ncbi:MAG: hypothetical protein JWN09_1035 [Microbacteriaceae bacterium]|nr:hypothetical protein [Microbacteriaceae bacterium]
MRMLFAILRIVVAVAIIAAVVGQLLVSADFWHGKGIQNITVNVTSFFSFFTIESNVLSVVVLVIGAWFLFSRRGADAPWYTGLRAATVTYMLTTGVVYNLLLRGIELPQGSTLGWSNEVLHLIAPLYLIIDWLLAPGRSPLASKAVWPILIFPLVWGIYTLVRGPITVDQVYGKPYWYPYPFLNPNISPEGYFSVAFYLVLIAAVIGLAGMGVVWASKRRLLTEPLAV